MLSSLRIRILTYRFGGGHRQGLPFSSNGKESVCNAGDLGLTPGLGRSSRERNGNSLHCLAWEITWTEEPAEIPSIRLQRAGHDWATNTTTATPQTFQSVAVGMMRCPSGTGVKNLLANAGDTRRGFNPWVVATYSSTLAWRIPWTEEPGGLLSIGSQCQTGPSMPHHAAGMRSNILMP